MQGVHVNMNGDCGTQKLNLGHVREKRMVTPTTQLSPQNKSLASQKNGWHYVYILWVRSHPL